MNKINAAVKLAIIVTMLMVSSLLGCSHLNNQPDNSAEGDSDYDKIQEINQDAGLKTILREYSAGQTSKDEVTAKLNELKERHTIKSYDWSSDGNTSFVHSREAWSISSVLPPLLIYNTQNAPAEHSAGAFLLT